MNRKKGNLGLGKIKLKTKKMGMIKARNNKKRENKLHKNGGMEMLRTAKRFSGSECQERALFRIRMMRSITHCFFVSDFNLYPLLSFSFLFVFAAFLCFFPTSFYLFLYYFFSIRTDQLLHIS